MFIQPVCIKYNFLSLLQLRPRRLPQGVLGGAGPRAPWRGVGAVRVGPRAVWRQGRHAPGVVLPRPCFGPRVPHGAQAE